MILLDKPYVSDFLKKTIIDYKFELIDNEVSQQILPEIKHLQAKEILEKIATNKALRLYLNSENSIQWVEENLSETEWPTKIKLFKNKVLFRQMIAHLHANYFFKPVLINELDSIDISDLKFPFIIKPSVGFFSMGVYKVDKPENWLGIIANIKEEIEEIKDLYPKEVIDLNEFIIEEYITGEEYAIDCYFDENGHVVILAILKHLFSSSVDVSDRIYITSADILDSLMAPIENYLNKIAALAQLKNFAAHVEIRIDEIGQIQPIEVNPMRFGGWCTTADLSYYAYGNNSYQFFLENLKPDWNSVFDRMGNDIFSIIVLDNSTSFESTEILSFDYEKLLKKFENPLELRKVNYKEYPVFGFLFAQTRAKNMQELEYILKSNLDEFIRAKEPRFR
jgi:hypothetical protein